MAVDDSTISDWARNNGFYVGERGRLSEPIKEAFYVTFPEHRPITNPNGTCAECYQPITAHRIWCSALATKEVPVTVTEYVDDIPQDDYPYPEPVAAETLENTPSTAPALSDATAMLGAALEALAANSAPVMDETRVREIATDAALEVVAEVNTLTIYAVSVREREPVMVEGAHKEFASVVKLLMRKRNVYLYGMPGTGKSTIAEQCATALGVQYGYITCHPAMTRSEMSGYLDVNGNPVKGLFWDVFVNGGVFNWEEIDNGHPGTVAAMNTALANGHYAFPWGVEKRHPESYFVAIGNTHGTGATRKFGARNTLDMATLDRFVEWEVGIDEDVERAGTLSQIADKALGDKWLTQVREWRANADRHNLDVIISPRGAMNGAVMLDEGFSWDQAAQACIFKGMDANTRAKVEGR